MLKRLEADRQERISKIKACDTTVPLTNGAKLVLHLIPTLLPDTPTHLDLASIEPTHEGLVLLGDAERAESRFNFEGRAVAYFPDEGETTRTYLQVFRNGMLESVCPLYFIDDHPGAQGRKMIPSLSVEPALIDSVLPYLRLLESLELTLPVACMISLTEVRGCGVLPKTRNRHWTNFRHSIDRENLLLPPVIFESLPPSEGEVASVLKPAFDVMWNAAGWERSMNYEAARYVRE